MGGSHSTVACVPETTATTEVGGPGGRGVVGTPGPGFTVGVGVGVGVADGEADADGEGDAEELADGVGEGVTTVPAGTKVAIALRALLIVTVQDVVKPVHAPVQPPKSAAGFGTACRVTVCVVG